MIVILLSNSNNWDVKHKVGSNFISVGKMYSYIILKTKFAHPFV